MTRPSTPAPGAQISVDGCPNCGWPDGVFYEVVSRHQTSTGVIVYGRCVCGALQVRQNAAPGQTRLLARGNPPRRRGPGPAVLAGGG